MPAPTPSCTHLGPQWDFDPVENECCYDYSDGVSCAPGEFACQSFNFCSMQCDNQLLPPGATTRISEAPYFGYLEDPDAIYSPCQEVGYRWNPISGGFLGPFMNLDPPCEAKDLDIEEQAGSDFFSSGNYYCIDGSGTKVDCSVPNTDPADNATYPTIVNPDAIYIVSANWQMMGCRKLIAPILNHRYKSSGPFPSITYNTSCIDTDPGPATATQSAHIWLGCPDGFSEQEYEYRTYGGGYEAFDCVLDDPECSRAPRDYVPLTFQTSGPCATRHTPAWDVVGDLWATSVTYFNRAYIPGTDPANQAQCGSIAYLVPTYGAKTPCYEDLVSGCPPLSDSESPPCLIDCQEPECPEGWEFNPFTGTCDPLSKGSPSILMAGENNRYIALEANEGIRVRKATFFSAPSDQDVVAVADTTARRPYLATDKRDRILLAYDLDDDILLTRSADKGATWETPETIMPGIGAAILQEPPNGGLYVVGLVPDGGGSFKLSAVWQGPGDTAFGTPFEPQLDVGGTLQSFELDEDNLDISTHKSDASRRWYMTATQAGGIPSLFESSDKGKTWKEKDL